MTLSLKPTSLVHDLGDKVVVFELNSSEMYQVEGDAAELIRFLYSKWQKSVPFEKVIDYLNDKSPNFKSLPNQKDTLLEAISYFKGVGIITYEA